MRRISPQVYVETFPGVGVGVVGEWVADAVGGGTFEVTVCLLCVTLNLELWVHPPAPRPPVPVLPRRGLR